MTSKAALHKILKEILHTEDENNIAIRRWELLYLKRRIDKKSESSILLNINSEY
jgi:hypothetical protein